MPAPSIRRRLRNLEKLTMFASLFAYPPFSGKEIQALAKRIVKDDRFTNEEIARMHQHSPLVHGEVMITAREGEIFMKRYIGLDLLVDL